MTDPTVSYRVHQATGMITAQADCSLIEAMQLLIIRGKHRNGELRAHFT